MLINWIQPSWLRRAETLKSTQLQLFGLRRGYQSIAIGSVTVGSVLELFTTHYECLSKLSEIWHLSQLDVALGLVPL